MSKGTNQSGFYRSFITDLKEVKMSHENHYIIQIRILHLKVA